MEENGCIELYELGDSSIVIKKPERANAYTIENDRTGRFYLRFYSSNKNGREGIPQDCSIIIIDSIIHSKTEVESTNCPRITYGARFYPSFI